MGHEQTPAAFPLLLFYDLESEITLTIILYDALHKLSEKSKGTAIKKIAPFEILKPAKVQIPPLNEQKRMLNKLAIINQIISS